MTFGLIKHTFTIELSIMWINGFLLYTLNIWAILLNICLCHDLIQTLTTPFDAGEQRLKQYIKFSSFVAVVTVSIV